MPLLSNGVSAAQAETYPSNVIRIVVPTGPGTPPDVISRVIATELSEAEGWRTIVENKPGALQTIGMAEVLKQPADGYTIYSMSVPTAAVPALMPNLRIRPDVDFTPVIKLSKSYNALVVPPSFPAKSISELMAVLKQSPGSTISLLRDLEPRRISSERCSNCRPVYRRSTCLISNRSNASATS